MFSLDENRANIFMKISKAVIITFYIGGLFITKDSQVDNKKARKKKSKGQTPLTQENENQSSNSKKQSAERNDV